MAEEKHEVRILDAAWDDLLRIRNWYVLNFSEGSADKVEDFPEELFLEPA